MTVITAGAAQAQILRTPASVNVSSQGASTVFISYGNLRPDQFSVEAQWCPTLIPATPDIGMRCDPANSWGRLPVRNDLSRPSGVRGFTDIMSIPHSLARRAYLAARERGLSEFYYVRQFSSTAGLPDEYVAVVCRMAGGGASTPLALVDVKLRFVADSPVLAVQSGTAPPPVVAEITYTGSGRLVGRWEVVQPGDEQPTLDDLLPAGSLPAEQRPLQRRFMELGRFNVNLPPVGTFRLEGPDPSRLPTRAEGLYQLLLRVEASPDSVGDPSLPGVGEGGGVLATGGLAGFPLPPLRYYVGSTVSPTLTLEGGLIQALAPADGATLPRAEADLSWVESSGISFLRVEVLDSVGVPVATAMLRPGAASYRLPPFVADRAAPGALRWRVVALDADGDQLAASEWRTMSLSMSPENGT
jgi:hypothetical protein